MKSQKIKAKKSKRLFWTPRIITIIFILFISMFALDVFGNCESFFTVLVALFMHLIPSLILIAVLSIFWRKSKALGIMWVIFGVAYIGLMIPGMLTRFEWFYLIWILQFSGVSFIIVYLFFRGLKK